MTNTNTTTKHTARRVGGALLLLALGAVAGYGLSRWWPQGGHGATHTAATGAAAPANVRSRTDPPASPRSNALHRQAREAHLPLQGHAHA